MSQLGKLQNDYKVIQKQGAVVIGISSEPPAVTKRALNTIKARFNVEVRFPLLSDTEKKTIEAYNATDFLAAGHARPTTYIIDKDGMIRWKSLTNVVQHGRMNAAQIIDELKKL